MATSALQTDQLLERQIGAEVGCRPVPCTGMQGLGVKQQAIKVKQAGVGRCGEIQRRHDW